MAFHLGQYKYDLYLILRHLAGRWRNSSDVAFTGNTFLYPMGWKVQIHFVCLQFFEQTESDALFSRLITSMAVCKLHDHDCTFLRCVFLSWHHQSFPACKKRCRPSNARKDIVWHTSYMVSENSDILPSLRMEPEIVNITVDVHSELLYR